MARTVTDAAILLGVLEGSVPDPNDPGDADCARCRANRDYTPYLKRDGAEGRAHRHSARLLLRQGDAARRDGARAAASTTIRRG